MADATSFAQHLYNPQGGGLATIRALQAGTQMGMEQQRQQRQNQLSDIKMRAMERAESKGMNVDDIGQQAKAAWIANDQRTFSEKLAQMSAIDPAAAKELNSVLGTLTKQNAVESGTNYFAAVSLPMKDVEAQNEMLSKAQEVLPEGHPFRRWMDQVKMLPEGEERLKALQGGLEVAKNLGMIPGATTGDTKLQKTGAYLVKDKNTGKMSIVAGSYNTATGEMKVSEGALPENYEVVSKMGETAEEAKQAKIQTAAKSEAAKQAVKASEKYAEKAITISEGIGTLDDAIRVVTDALDNGENLGTGPIMQYAPKWNTAAIELENIGNQLGLDVIRSATFGALSENEMKTAMSTAKPPALKGPALRNWLIKKRNAQDKLKRYFEDAAAFIGSEDPETGDIRTKADWIKYQRKQYKTETAERRQPPQPAETQAEINSLLEGL